MATLKLPRLFGSSICHACRQRLLSATYSSTRALSTTPSPRADGSWRTRNGSSASISDILENGRNDFLGNELTGAGEDNEPHRLHVYATKHNTHLTFVQPSKPASQTTSSGVSGTSASAKDQKKMVDVLLSISTGNIGFRKAGRGSYDAAYQLAAFALKQMQDKGMLKDMHSLQVVMRGFGAGREAVTKAILGTEGRFIRNRIVSVLDATRLKRGGPRSKKPRRLG